MAKKRAAKARRSPAEIAKAWKKLEPAFEQRRRQHKGNREHTFVAISCEEFEAKMKRAFLFNVI